MRKSGYPASTISSVAQLHKALSDPTRIRIVHLLLHRGELCVCDVEGILETTQSKVSRHLSQLKQVGIVSDQRRGAWVYYRIASSPAPGLRSALRDIKRMLAEDPEATADLRRAEIVEREASCRPIEPVRRRG